MIGNITESGACVRGQVIMTKGFTQCSAVSPTQAGTEGVSSKEHGHRHRGKELREDDQTAFRKKARAIRKASTEPFHPDVATFRGLIG